MKSYRVVGLMSGTSMDGVDVALCVFENKNSRWNFSIECARTVPYTQGWKKRLAGCVNAGAEELAFMNASYGQFLGSLVKEFLINNKISADFVASHGHTVFHQPSREFTYQLGDGAAISAACGLPVVCDFRSADVALGGEGAPLVPVGDQFLFSEYKSCLNLGGIANISFDKGGKRIAFDICPVNLLLNPLALEKGKSYDAGGKLAMKGKVREKLLGKLNAIPFYKKPFPKSLGREDIEKFFLKILEKDSGSPEDKLCTLCEHMAIQVSAVAPSGKMLVTGGGAYNTFLISRMKACVKADVVIPESQAIEFKEALIFAFLGVLRWRNEVNCLASVTGAIRDSSGGAIYHP